MKVTKNFLWKFLKTLVVFQKFGKHGEIAFSVEYSWPSLQNVYILSFADTILLTNQEAHNTFYQGKSTFRSIKKVKNIINVISYYSPNFVTFLPPPS